VIPEDFLPEARHGAPFHGSVWTLLLGRRKIRSPSQRGDRGPGAVNGFPCSLIQFPARANRIPCSFYPGIRLEMLGFTLHSAALPQAGRPESRISLHNSLLL
jgi:hypothetical protein